MEDKTYITCPNCGEKIDVEDAVAHRLEADIRDGLEKEYNRKSDVLSHKEKELEEKTRDQEKSIREALRNREKVLKDELKAELAEENKDRLSSLDEELKSARSKLRESREKEIELERLKRKQEDQEREFQLQLERAVSENRKMTEEEVSKRMGERSEMQLREKDKQLDDLKSQITELRRKAEQGSMQLQGEVQELALEELLAAAFPEDSVDPVPKGIKGGDSVLRVMTPTAEEAGSILYESKRTKAFSAQWLTKLRDDQRAANADVSVLVTQVMPAGTEDIAYQDGVWVCTYGRVETLSAILRDGILKVHAAKGMQSNSGDKMHMLYDYLTSNEFKLRIEGILEGFMSLKDSVNRERMAMEKLWKEREKQLEKVLLNTTHFYGSVKGIAGAGVPAIPQLELVDDEQSV